MPALNIFTASGTYTPTPGVTHVQVLVVAGGGHGGEGGYGGGGGGGGVIYNGFYPIGAGPFTVTVGAGGSPGDGGNSVFDTLTAIGGGKGAHGEDYAAAAGNPGGSGGGGGGASYVAYGAGGSGTANQGYDGKAGQYVGGGGGGGAGQAATNKNGGNGRQYSISGVAAYYGGGGGGVTNPTGGIGGLGGGGDGQWYTQGPSGLPGADNTGGGGGAGDSSGGNGGSGIVIIQELTPAHIFKIDNVEKAKIHKAGLSLTNPNPLSIELNNTAAPSGTTYPSKLTLATGWDSPNIPVSTITADNSLKIVVNTAVIIPYLNTGGYVKASAGGGVLSVVSQVPAADISGYLDNGAKVTANDTTAGYLNGKLVAGNGIGFAVGTPGGNETLTIALEGTLVDYSAVSTVVGWDTVTPPTVNIRYMKVGKVVKVWWHIVGIASVAGGTLASFTMPAALVNAVGYDIEAAMYGFTGGTNIRNPLIHMVNGSNIVQIYRDGLSITWPTSGAKECGGFFEYVTN